jgi:hypothetical protein
VPAVAEPLDTSPRVATPAGALVSLRVYSSVAARIRSVVRAVSGVVYSPVGENRDDPSFEHGSDRRREAVAKHDISLEIPHGITVVNKDIEVTVREDGKILGRVRISKGSIDWLAANRQRVKYLPWSGFARLMDDEGRDRR